MANATPRQELAIDDTELPLPTRVPNILYVMADILAGPTSLAGALRSKGDLTKHQSDYTPTLLPPQRWNELSNLDEYLRDINLQDEKNSWSRPLRIPVAQENGSNASGDDVLTKYLKECHEDAKPLALKRLKWLVYQDKTQRLLSGVAVISLGLGLCRSFGVKHLLPSSMPPSGWIEGVAICVAIMIIVHIEALNDYRKEQTFMRLNSTVHVHNLSTRCRIIDSRQEDHERKAQSGKFVEIPDHTRISFPASALGRNNPDGVAEDPTNGLQGSLRSYSLPPGHRLEKGSSKEKEIRSKEELSRLGSLLHSNTKHSPTNQSLPVRGPYVDVLSNLEGLVYCHCVNRLGRTPQTCFGDFTTRSHADVDTYPNHENYYQGLQLDRLGYSLRVPIRRRKISFHQGLLRLGGALFTLPLLTAAAIAPGMGIQAGTYLSGVTAAMSGFALMEVPSDPRAGPVLRWPLFAVWSLAVPLFVCFMSCWLRQDRVRFVLLSIALDLILIVAFSQSMTSVAEGIITFGPLFTPTSTFLAYLFIKATGDRERATAGAVASPEPGNAGDIPLNSLPQEPVENRRANRTSLHQTPSTITLVEHDASSNSRGPARDTGRVL